MRKMQTTFAVALAGVLLGSAAPALGKEKKEDAAPRIIPKTKFIEALKKLADDERMPFASSTLVEKGRGAAYYAVEKLHDGKPDTFWAEGQKGTGKHEWVAFYLPEDSTHVQIIPGAGREQFNNFNRPKRIRLDIYLAHLKRNKETDEYAPTFNHLGQIIYNFGDSAKAISKKLPVKLPELALTNRTMYVGVAIILDVYKGQFDDTAIAEIKPSSVWGEL